MEARSTYIDLPKGSIFTFINREGDKRDLIVFSNIFACSICKTRQRVDISQSQDSNKTNKLRIEEFHQKFCDYYK